MQLKLPVQGVVDRAAILDIYQIPNPVTDPDTPQGLQFGTLPNDPDWFSERVNPRVAVCQILSSYAAARCLHGRGYF
jgi:hypothetical protein